LDIPIDVMIGMMISVATVVMIVGITIAVVMGEIAAITESDHHGSQNYCLLNS
jgi:hypothetical protein